MLKNKSMSVRVLMAPAGRQQITTPQRHNATTPQRHNATTPQRFYDQVLIGLPLIWLDRYFNVHIWLEENKWVNT
jgi:hypothetical protein